MTIKLSRMQVFYSSLSLMILGLLLYKLSFIIISNTTTGEVVGIKSWSTRGRYPGTYSAPIIKFKTGKNNITFQGETNIHLQYGDSVTVIYNKSEPTEASVYSFIGFWLTPIIYCFLGYFLLIATAIFSYINKGEFLSIELNRKIKIIKMKQILLK